MRNDSLKGKPYAVKVANEWLQKLSALDEGKEVEGLSENHDSIIEKALERRAKRQEKRAGDV